MSAAEESLKATLEAHPDDWSIRWIVIDKMLERGASDEAAEMIAAATEPPENESELQRLAEVGEASSVPLIEKFVQTHPASAYGHELLASMLEWLGQKEKAEQHYAVAQALNGHAPAEETEHLVEEVAHEASVTQEELAHAPSAPPAVPTLVHSEEPLGMYTDAPEFVAPKQNGGKLASILVAIAVHLIIGLIAYVVVILPPNKDDPEIVAAIAPPSKKKQEMQKKNVVKQTKKTSASAAAAAPLAQLMRANAVARISMPKVTKTSTGPLGIGDADFGGGGFGSGGDGLGMGASFFGGSSTGKRFLFIIDHSGSMKKNQVDLRNKEVERALKSLKGVQYQVLLFAGGGYYAWEGWSNQRQGKDNIVKDPKGTYKFVSKGGYADYDFRGADSKLPKEKWLDANSTNVKKTMNVIKKHPLFGGTDWELALRIGHVMEPSPDVIFFMSDGTGGNAPAPILSFNSKHGKPVINTVAMQTTAGLKEFSTIAQKTKGSFTIVDKKGKPIDGFDFQKNPAKYKGRL